MPGVSQRRLEQVDDSLPRRGARRQLARLRRAARYGEGSSQGVSEEALSKSGVLGAAVHK